MKKIAINELRLRIATESTRSLSQSNFQKYIDSIVEKIPSAPDRVASLCLMISARINDLQKNVDELYNLKQHQHRLRKELDQI